MLAFATCWEEVWAAEGKYVREVLRVGRGKVTGGFTVCPGGLKIVWTVTVPGLQTVIGFASPEAVLGMSFRSG